jgi:hypothetical protein
VSKKTQGRLEAKDNSFKNLIKIKKGSGKATRIGLVPLGMAFDDFASKFDLVYKSAVKIYNAEYEDEQIPDPLPCYLMRIFPSEYGLKEIMLESDAEARPISIVKELLQQKLSKADEVKLMSLIQSARSGKEGFKAVIRTIIDHPASSIKSIMGRSMEALLEKSNRLKGWFESKEADKYLFVVYKAERMSELCEKVVSYVPSDLKASELFFVNKFNEGIPESKKLSDADKNAIADFVWKRLRSIGVGLTA